MPIDCIDVNAAGHYHAAQVTSPALAWLVYGRALSPSEVAASLSHRKAWATAYRADCDWALIYEDDVIPKPDALEPELNQLETYVSARPVMINFSPAQTVRPRRPHLLPQDLPLPDLTPVWTYTTNAQAYAVNRAGLRELARFLSGPIVRPPDFPPAVTQLDHFAARRGRCFEIETEGDSTVGSRDEITYPSRVLRWGLRLTGATYLAAPQLYGSPRNFLRYEILQRIEHRMWRVGAARHQ
jgi:hypothetical protein